MTDTPTRTPAEIADALEARAEQDDTFEREIVNNGGAVSARAKARVALDRAAAARLRAMDDALAKIASWPCLGDNHNPMKPAVDGMREAARTARGES